MGLIMNNEAKIISFEEEIKELEQVKLEISDREYMKLLDDILIRMLQNIRSVIT